MTVSETIDRLFSRIQKRNTRASYQGTLEPFREVFGCRDIAEITPGDIKIYLAALDVSANTKHLRYVHINSLFNAALQALREVRIRPEWDNPCDCIKSDFEADKQPPPPLSDTINADMQAVESSLRAKHRLIYSLGVVARLRVSEILSLRPVDLMRQNGKHFLRLKDTKSGPDQFMPIPEWLYNDLEKFAAVRGIIDLARIFPVSRQAVWALLRRRGIQPHDLRRYGAYVLMSEGMNLKTIQGSLRHASAQTTERYLRDLSPVALEAELSKSRTWERRAV